ncbi:MULTISPECIES: complex I NDUFA9 subunit family protein [unclassified Brevundimonas]|uniref:complex I NDUFA9 subunit family protein n=1 Tax=unclassified Brevundimonas TaxID=2622653 RepID=UPI0006F59A72|nr:MULTISPECIES: complex I NDUFA9 subunit family protein [unclassified Brevundimonas]KQY79314.1 3-beta hydroxysteroid dehydrogenase [Brevundimonas sp. Root1423]KRA26595.1 3-beta hydroxysteroid dehydrogenase [Brevundimonas sp. Root608]
MSEVAPGLVTVFGGSGFVGSQLVRAFARRGWRVRVACRRPDRAWKLQTSGSVGQIQAVRCDANNTDDVASALHGADAAVNLIGILYESGRRSFHALHVEASRNIAEAVAAANINRLVQISAIGADPESESDYALSKAAAEMAVREVKPDAVVIRPSIIFGAGDDFLNRFAQMAQVSPFLPLIGGGKTRFQPVYVADVAEAIARATVLPEAAGRTFELGGPAVMTFEEVLKLILRETYRSNGLIPLPFFAARAIGSMAQLTAMVGIPPVLTRDQVVLLEKDNVVADGAEGLAELGVQPTGIEAIAPSYLWRYRRGGQFAEATA